MKKVFSTAIFMKRGRECSRAILTLEKKWIPTVYKKQANKQKNKQSDEQTNKQTNCSSQIEANPCNVW